MIKIKTVFCYKVIEFPAINSHSLTKSCVLRLLSLILCLFVPLTLVGSQSAKNAEFQ